MDNERWRQLLALSPESYNNADYHSIWMIINAIVASGVNTKEAIRRIGNDDLALKEMAAKAIEELVKYADVTVPQVEQILMYKKDRMGAGPCGGPDSMREGNRVDALHWYENRVRYMKLVEQLRERPEFTMKFPILQL